MWITVRPAASSTRAAVWTSMTWKGAISATRAAKRARDSIESRRAYWAVKRYRNAPMGMKAKGSHRAHAALAAVTLTLAAAAAPAFATIYKCQGDTGAPVYQD